MAKRSDGAPGNPERTEKVWLSRSPVTPPNQVRPGGTLLSRTAASHRHQRCRGAHAGEAANSLVRDPEERADRAHGPPPAARMAAALNVPGMLRLHA